MTVDATIVGAPRSTKKPDKACHPQIHQTCKSQQWHFNMKLHIGVIGRIGLVHRAAMTTSNAHDKHVLDDLLHWKE
ncbi:transposase [Xanthomonas campestris]|uniref:transposase n=1 Tax=Xanthomonas campestris TaxID=339 RepID=UPI0020C9EF41|nr:transposase [Xanthomonas campestris]